MALDSHWLDEIIGAERDPVNIASAILSSQPFRSIVAAAVEKACEATSNPTEHVIRVRMGIIDGVVQQPNSVQNWAVIPPHWLDRLGPATLEPEAVLLAIGQCPDYKAVVENAVEQAIAVEHDYVCHNIERAPFAKLVRGRIIAGFAKI